jgi:uptake hydrogenase large subunit
MTTAIPAEGRVDLRLDWDGERVVAATVRSRRPQPRRLLLGQPPEHARQVIPRLYSLCGDAQAVAVDALLGLLDPAGIGSSQSVAWAARIRLETIREHLWRLGLDWARMAGLEPQPGPLRGLLAGREQFASDDRSAREWAAQTHQSLFGMDGVPGPERLDLPALEHWLRAGGSSLAVLLRELRPRLVGLGRSRAKAFASADLPAFAIDALPRLREDPDFHWCPDWSGEVFEMGPWARGRALPLLAELEAEQGGVDAWTRVVARVLELAGELEALMQGEPARQAMAWHRQGDEAVVALEMARGVLLHWIRLDEGRIGDYRIVAPTEWNFHPHGPAQESLGRLQGTDAQTLRDAVTRVVMALDPCVHYELEIAHA